MLQKDKSVTTSSKSLTNNAPHKACETPIQFVKGIGPGLGTIFRNRDIHTAQDLLFFLPRAYEDRSRMQSISELSEGATTTLALKVLSQRKIPLSKWGSGKTLLEVRCTDGTGYLNLKWFHCPRGMDKKFIPGVQFIVTGKVKFYQGTPEILHPEITWDQMADTSQKQEGSEHHNFGRIVPIYTEIDGVQTRTLRKVLWEAVSGFADKLEEDVPPYLLEKRKLPTLGQAIAELHFPPENTQVPFESIAEFRTPAHHRLIYGEFFKFEYFMLRKKLRFERACPHELNRKAFSESRWKKFAALLPFQLTRGQEQSLHEIHKDFLGESPMNRLIQGDVGSGKTAVAFLSAMSILEAGGQVAMMAPTEILAEQHFLNGQKLFGGKLNIALLTGKTPQSERLILQQRLSKGEPLLVVGTHALIEEGVQFTKLAYALVDEQHRFGVEQRKALRLKGVEKDLKTGKVTAPHSLVLTATPIPRTLALTAFGDLEVTSIRELPPGRTPVKTLVIASNDQKSRTFDHIRTELKAGRQAYFIYPLVNDSEAEGFTQLKSAVTETQSLANEVFPEFKVGLLHGQMKPDEKAEVMDRFKQKQYHILVSTTVVEVGVDVPNATIIVIQHAERFGLSQLHQLRGRVGRGQHASYCYLFSTSKAAGGVNARLEVLVESTDGFKIAEADLEIRGPGEFLGTRQAGALPFKVANLVRDQEWLIQARDDAMSVLSSDPELKLSQHACLRTFLEAGSGGLGLSS